MTTAFTASSSRSPSAVSFSSLSARSSIASATIVLRTVFGNASDMLDPSARNSNLLPVKANGEVRLRSPPCIGSGGSTGVPEAEERARRVAVALAGRDRLEHLVELGAEEDRDDRRRRLVGAEAVVLADVRDRGPQQALVLVDGLDHRGAEEQEADVLRRRVARLHQVVAGVGAHRPVVVLAGAVDAGERLLVQQADEPVLAGHVLHDLHRQLLVVGADVRVLEDRRELVLARGDLVVAGLDRHAELSQLDLGYPSCRRARARGSSRSSGRRARGPSAAWRRTASARSSPGRGARSSTARRSGSTPARGRRW